MRLDKYLANMGVGSRKDVKKIISSGRVSVNGAIVKKAECDVKVEDTVAVDGGKIDYKEFVYLMMNKPAGVISATEDAHGEVCAADLVGSDYNFYQLSCAGRLDKDSEGFLLLTNDGDFIHNIISPKKKVDKIYYIEVDGELTEKDTELLAEGITLGDGYVTLLAKLTVTEAANGKSKALVTIHEGKFHQVKRMIKSCGKTVTYLKRLSIGGVTLDESLEKGAYRELTREELEELYEKTGD